LRGCRVFADRTNRNFADGKVGVSRIADCTNRGGVAIAIRDFVIPARGG